MDPKKKIRGGSRDAIWKYGEPVPQSFFDILREKDPDGQEMQRDGAQEDPAKDPERHEEGDQCQD